MTALLHRQYHILGAVALEGHPASGKDLRMGCEVLIRQLLHRLWHRRQRAEVVVELEVGIEADETFLKVRVVAAEEHLLTGMPVGGEDDVGHVGVGAADVACE